MGDNSLHFHLLYDPRTNHCYALGVSFSSYTMGKKGPGTLLGISGELIHCSGNHRCKVREDSKKPQEPFLADWDFTS